MLPASLWLALVRAMLVVDDGTRITPLSLHGEGSETRMLLFSHRQSEYRIRGEKEYRRTKPSPRGEGGERSEPDRVLAG